MRKISLAIGVLQELFGDKGALRKARELGLDGVDLDLLRFDDTLYLRPRAEIEAYFHELRDEADRIGIAVAQTHGRIAGRRPDPEFNARMLRFAELDLMATRILGAEFCVMHGVNSSRWGRHADPQAMRDRNDAMFRDYLPFAVENRVTIATETFGDSHSRVPGEDPETAFLDFFGDAGEFLAAYRRIAAEPTFAPHFRVCVDTGHTNKAHRFPGEPTAGDLIRMLGSAVGCLHLNDNDMMTDQHLVPLAGSLDWDDVLAALDEIGYRGWYSMELALRRFGGSPEMVMAYAAFAVKVMRELLRDRCPA